MLKEHKEEAFARGLAKPGDLVFCADTGGSLRHRTVGWQLTKAVNACGLPALRWHDLRHIAASVMIREGADRVYLARVLGHSSPAVTEAMYAHEFAAVENDDRMRDRMEAAFGEVLQESS